MSIIEFKNVTFNYNKKELVPQSALNDISFSIEKGDLFSIVGKTGSGKTTLIQTLNALLLPTFGYTKVGDYIVSEDKNVKKVLIKSKEKTKKDFKKYAGLRKKVGMVFQFSEYQLFADTVLKDVMFGPINFGLSEEDAKKKAIENLHKLKVDDSLFNRSPFELSGGQKRRVAFAGILASEPDILVLDEPTVGLDSDGKKEIIKIIQDINKSGVSVIIVTHDMDLVTYSSKVAILQDSKLLKITTPKELFNENDIEKYSLEIPTLYKFKNLLKKYGYSKDLSKVNDFDSLIEVLKD